MSQDLLSCLLDSVCPGYGILYWVFVLPLLWDKVLKMKLKLKLNLKLELILKLKFNLKLKWELELNLKLKLKLKLKFLHWVSFLVWPNSRNVAGTNVSLCKFKWVCLVVCQDFWMISLIQGVQWKFLFSLPNEGL